MLLGSAIKITDTMTVDDSGSVDSASIIITDPDGTVVVASTAMTDDGSNVFSYKYASVAGGDTGYHTANIKALSGANVGLGRIAFRLEA